MRIDNAARLQNGLCQERKHDFENVDENDKPDQAPQDKGVPLNPYEHHRCHHEGAVTEISARYHGSVNDR
ncbi:hypothetical protein D3C73_966470 [compost metagenome]